MFSLKFPVAVILALGCIVSVPATGSAQDVESAREKHELLTLELEKTERLSETGSASRKQLRRARFEKRIAGLELATLTTPDREDEFLLESARLTLKFELTEFEVVKSLFERGSASELEYRRARTRLKMADLQFEHIRDSGDPKWYAFDVSLAQFRQAEYEFNAATRLEQSGSLARSILERADQNFQSATRNLDLARSALGLRVTVIGNR